MPTPTDATAKRCIYCGQDCSKKPRVKDPQGRYSCRECVDQRQAAAAPIPIEEPLPIGLADMESAASPATGLQVCPNCQSSMPHGAPICVQCGYDARKGAAISTVQSVDNLRSGGKGKCPECGYSLKGLKEPRCPECGTVVTRQTQREKARYDSSRIARMAYIKPVLQFAIGVTVVMFYFPSQNEAEAIGRYLLGYAIKVPTGIAAFFLCCLLWMGFDAPMHLTALRLAGVYALVDTAAVFLSMLPLPLISWAILLFIYVGLLAESLDLDIQDAIIVGLLTFLIRFAVVIAIAVYFPE